MASEEEVAATIAYLEGILKGVHASRFTTSESLINIIDQESYQSVSSCGLWYVFFSMSLALLTSSVYPVVLLYDWLLTLPDEVR